MVRLLYGLCFSLVVFACATPCFAQRSDAPSDLCQGLANVPTSICIDREYRSANIQLKGLIADIQKTLKPEERQKLVSAQKVWEKYRDLTCEVDSIVYFDGGSGHSTEFSTCLYVETRLQIKDLHAIYDWEMRPH